MQWWCVLGNIVNFQTHISVINYKWINVFMCRAKYVTVIRLGCISETTDNCWFLKIRTQFMLNVCSQYHPHDSQSLVLWWCIISYFAWRKRWYKHVAIWVQDSGIAYICKTASWYLKQTHEIQSVNVISHYLMGSSTFISDSLTHNMPQRLVTNVVVEQH